MVNSLEEIIASITRISVFQWGNSLKIEGINDFIEQKQYCVIYKNCKSIAWEMMEDDPEELASDCTALLWWDIGEGNHGKPATLYTTFFELNILYESYEVIQID